MLLLVYGTELINLANNGRQETRSWLKFRKLVQLGIKPIWLF